MPLKPDVTVAAVTEIDGRFLCVEERINQRSCFNQPAGHVEDGETLLEAVIREVREETAWRFEPRGAARRLPVAQSGSNGRSTLRFAFTGTRRTITSPRGRWTTGIVAHALADPR